MEERVDLTLILPMECLLERLNVTVMARLERLCFTVDYFIQEAIGLSFLTRHCSPTRENFDKSINWDSLSDFIIEMIELKEGGMDSQNPSGIHYYHDLTAMLQDCVGIIWEFYNFVYPFVQQELAYFSNAEELDYVSVEYWVQDTAFIHINFYKLPF